LLIGAICLGACGKKEEKTQLEKDYEISNATSATNGEINAEGTFKLKADTFTLKCDEEIGSDFSKYIDEKNTDDFILALENGEEYVLNGKTLDQTKYDYPTKVTMSFVNIKTKEYKLVKFIWDDPLLECNK